MRFFHPAASLRDEKTASSDLEVLAAPDAVIGDVGQGRLLGGVMAVAIAILATAVAVVR
jgi:hypothetical protein